MARKQNEIRYAEATEELAAILDEIEHGTADVDELSAKVERAAELIRACREKLSGTETRVRKIVEAIEGETEALAADDSADGDGTGDRSQP